MPKSLKSRCTINLINEMEKKDLVKFNKQEIEIINSEIELSEVRGGKGWIGAVISAVKEFFDGEDEAPNTNCHGCNPSCQ